VSWLENYPILAFQTNMSKVKFHQKYGVRANVLGKMDRKLTLAELQLLKLPILMQLL
jgi:hypothetical protein